MKPALVTSAVRSLRRLSTLLFFLTAVVIIWLAASWGILLPGPFPMHDYLHVARIRAMLDALHDGHFPVRWSQHFGFGYGSPIFQFYAPLAYYLGALLVMLGNSEITSMEILFGLSTFGALLGAYLLGKALFNRWGGLLLSSLFVLFPYRAVDIYVRGALSELWGMLWFPWIAYGMYRIADRPKLGILITALSIWGLSLSHNLMSYTYLPLSILVGLGLLYSQLNRHKKPNWHYSLGVMIIAFVLGLGMATSYLLPSWYEKGITKVELATTTGYFSYTNHFVYPFQLVLPIWGYRGFEIGPNDLVSYFLGWGQLFGIGMTLAVSVIYALRFYSKKGTHFFETQTHSFKPLFLVALVLSVVTLVMTTELSSSIWKLIPAFKYIQFPARWLALFGFFSSLTTTIAVMTIRTPKWRRLALLLTLALVFCNTVFFRPDKSPPDLDQYYFADPNEVVNELGLAWGDFMPIHMPDIPLPASQSFALLSADAATQAAVLSEATHYQQISTNFSTPQILSFSIAEFPGWKVYLDGTAISTSRNARGLLTVTVPTGQHLVEARLTNTPVRSFGDGVSIVSWIIFGGLLLFSFGRYWPLKRWSQKDRLSLAYHHHVLKHG